MTLNEATERARVIWGDVTPNQIQIRPDGGADLDFGYSEYPPYGLHRLDRNGHVACHHFCQELERDHTTVVVAVTPTEKGAR